MDKTYITALNINKVRHLKEIQIPIAQDERRHLILTGKNGSGKTSILEAFSKHLDYIVSPDFFTKSEIESSISSFEEEIKKLSDKESQFSRKKSFEQALTSKKISLKMWTEGVVADYTSLSKLRDKYDNGEFILAYYSDNRSFHVNVSKSIEKIDLLPVYALDSHPGRDFAKYLVTLKTKQAFAQTENKLKRASEIKAWFDRFQDILRDLYEESDLTLEFDTDKFEFNILLKNREPFSFNTMSMGYSAVFDIICDLIMRMESKQNYNLEGIVLIDEIETHLHVELQRKIMPVLIKLFPNIQFILTTHSPFILNSVQNAVVYDLENQTLAEEGLSNYTYNGIVEGYFKSDLLSKELRKKYDRYRELATQKTLSDDDYAELSELEIYLDEIPDYLALSFMPEYKRLKLEVNS